MRGRPPSRTRVVQYYFEGDFDEAPVERVLEAARVRGVVTLFDTGRGRVVWFEGPPGAEMRAVRDKVRSMVTPAP